METLKNVWPEWQIEGVLGEGSFGKVYKIKREDVGGTFYAALKEIRIPKDKSEVKAIQAEGMDEASTTAYFKSIMEEIVKEFALMEKFKGNTNIVSYEDHRVVPNEDGYGWDILIRMELLTPMTQYITEHPLTEELVIKIGTDMCRALELCERYHVIHRDIKPENIFVSEMGDFKLGDFGVARTAEKTMSNMSKKGTYTYMAPEVYKGESYNATVDIYSLGIVLYRLLNDNRAPFLPPVPQPISFSDRESALEKRVAGTPIPAPKHGNQKLIDVILKACAYRSEDRYQTAEELRTALEGVMKSAPAPETQPQVKPAKAQSVTPAQKAPAVKQQPKPQKKQKQKSSGAVKEGLIIGGVVVAAVLVAVVAGFIALVKYSRGEDVILVSVKTPASVTSVISPELDAEAYEAPGINIVPTKMLYTQRKYESGGSEILGITPVEGYEADEHDNSLYYPQWFWGDWELLGTMDGSETYEDKSVTLLDDGVAKKVLYVFPTEFKLYPAWDDIFGDFDLTSEASADVMDDYGVTAYCGYGYFRTTATQGDTSVYDIFYDTHQNYLTLGVVTSYVDENGEETTYSDEIDAASYEANITPIDFKISWQGYYLTLTYEDETVVYIASDAKDNLEMGYEVSPGLQSWALSSEDTLGNLAMVCKNWVSYAPYYDITVDEFITNSYGEDGTFTLSTNDVYQNDIMLSAVSYQFRYLYSDDNVILVDEDGTAAMYSSDKEAWSEDSLEADLNWREAIGF